MPTILEDGRKIWKGRIKDETLRKSFADKLQKPNPELGLRGAVRINHIRKNADGSEEIVETFEKSNLVVHNGRLWGFHKIFDYPASTIANYKPYWWSCGEGGATTDNPMNPLYPLDHDVALYSPVVLDPTNVTFADNGYKAPLAPGTNFITENIIAIIYSVYIDFNQATGAGTTNLNELGLWLAPTQDPTETTFMLLSHVCMATRPKTTADAYEFEWWLYM